jgi:hypothetical protein
MEKRQFGMYPGQYFPHMGYPQMGGFQGYPQMGYPQMGGYHGYPLFGGYHGYPQMSAPYYGMRKTDKK